MAFQQDSIFWVELEKIVPNPYQPRREFDAKRLEELSESIRMYGVLQPLTVTRKEIQRDDGSFHTEYELIAGERRLRASKLAGISLVPVIIREGEQNEQEKLELAIIENLQREDLNAVDRAMAFKQLADSFNLSHVQVAKKVGRSREYVSNSVRLLALPELMLQGLRTGDISEGHARTLLMLNEKPQEQETVFREIILKKLSVREVERIARSIATDKVRKRDKNFDPELIEMEKKFTETLGTRVQIQKTEFGGKLTIDYFSPDDLAYMLRRMKQEADNEAAGRKPFSPPNEAVNDSEDDLQAVTDATPLSALIAQLQQAEATDNHSGAPAAPISEKEPTVTLYDEPPQHTTDSYAKTDDEIALPERSVYDDRYDTYEPSQVERREVTIFTTDAPVSLVQYEVESSHQYKMENSSRNTPPAQPAAPAPHETQSAPTVAAEPKPEPSRGPRIVAIRRDATSAMYVASVLPDMPQQQSEPEQFISSESNTEAAQSVPAVDDDADGDLYSIRNFNV